MPNTEKLAKLIEQLHSEIQSARARSIFRWVALIAILFLYLLWERGGSP